jgi:hypothetical protein
VDLGRFFSLLIYTQSVGPLGRGISPSQGCYLHTEEHKHRINAHNIDIHALSSIRTHDPSVRASEDSSCLRPRGHCDRRSTLLQSLNNAQIRNLIVQYLLPTDVKSTETQPVCRLGRIPVFSPPDREQSHFASVYVHLDIPDFNGLKQKVLRRFVTWPQVERRRFLIRARWVNHATCQTVGRASQGLTSHVYF